VDTVSNDTARRAGAEPKRNPASTSPYVTRKSSGKGLPQGLKSAATRPWMIVAGLALLGGLGTGVLMSSWRTGVSMAVLLLIAALFYVSQTHSEIPRWRKPSAAQRRTEVQLRPVQRLFGYRVLHARAVPGGNGVIDHFIVGKRGAFTIDSESWDRRLPVRNKLEKLYHGKFSKNERLDEALEEARLAQELISKQLGREITVHPALVIYGPKMPWDIHRMRGIDVIKGKNVRKWLRREGKDKLTEREIERIYEAARTALPPRYGEQGS
jgi:hypothetical protein